jgi:hypothetical protein
MLRTQFKNPYDLSYATYDYPLEQCIKEVHKGIITRERIPCNGHVIAWNLLHPLIGTESGGGVGNFFVFLMAGGDSTWTIEYWKIKCLFVYFNLFHLFLFTLFFF